MAGFYNSYKTVGSSSYKIDPFTGQVIPGYVSEEEYLGGLSTVNRLKYNTAADVGQLYGESAAPVDAAPAEDTETPSDAAPAEDTAAPADTVTSSSPMLTSQPGAFSYSNNTIANPNLINMTVANPYVRAMMEAGLQNGATYNILTPEGYNQMLAARQAELQAAVVNPLKAAETESMRGVAGYLNKQGKFGSSALPSQLMRTSESYNANVASELAKANLDIYGQLDAQREAELNRLYGGGMAQLESETQRQIAAAGTALGYDELAQKWDEFTIANESDLYKFGQSIDLERAATINPDTGKPYTYEVEKYGIDRSYNLGLINDQTQRDLTFAAIDKDYYDIDTKAKLATDALAERYYEVDLTDASNLRMFFADLEQTKELHLLDNEQTANFFDRTMNETIRNNDMTDATTRFGIVESIKSAKDLKLIDDTRERELTAMALSETARQFDITTANGMKQWVAAFNEDMRRHDINREDQVWLAKRTLDLQVKELAGTTTANNIQNVMNILSTPQMEGYLYEIGDNGKFKTDKHGNRVLRTEAAGVMEDMLDYIENGGDLAKYNPTTTEVEAPPEAPAGTPQSEDVDDTPVYPDYILNI